MSMNKREPQSIRSSKITYSIMQEKRRAEKAAGKLPLSTWEYRQVMKAVERWEKEQNSKKKIMEVVEK